MTRLLLGAAIGLFVGVVGGAALGLRADDVDAAVLEAAEAAHVDPIKLAGAVNTTQTDPWVYLRAVGELPAPVAASPAPPVPAATSSRVACIVRVESRGDAHARNASGASGLGQFLPGTWRSTPQGKAGLSVYDPVANRAAIQWMLNVGRAREFDAVRFYGC